MKPKVYFYDNVKQLEKGTNIFLEKISKDISGKVGLKIHFGEKNNDTHIDPQLLKDIKKYLEDPVFIECNVLYRGHRTQKSDHIKIAKKHGFGFLPIDILDGEMGEEEVHIPVNTENTKKARIGAGIQKYNNIISLAHFKGHSATGFGGALKNMGMGLGSRAGKLDMHSSMRPYVSENCTGCGICVDKCDFDAIVIENKKAKVTDKCKGCAMCIAVCPNDAMQIPFGSDTSERLMEKIADYTKAVVDGRECWFVNFLTNITKRCDCPAVKQEPFMEDLGILMSKDPIAIDQASLDLIRKSKSKEVFKEITGVNGVHILEYGEEIGLGSRKYELIEENGPGEI